MNHNCYLIAMKPAAFVGTQALLVTRSQASLEPNQLTQVIWFLLVLRVGCQPLRLEAILFKLTAADGALARG